MTKISRASLRSYTTTHLTYRPPDEARRLLHEHANAIILRAGKALAEILPESEASIAALDALGMARMRCNQAIAHGECDVDEAKARVSKAATNRETADTFDVEAAGARIGGASRVARGMSAERLLEWAEEHLTAPTQVVVSEWLRGNATDLSVPNAGYAMGRRGHMTIARNLGGALPEPTDVADTNTFGADDGGAEFGADLGEVVDAEFADDLPEGFDRHEALSELAGYGFENGTLLKCSDAELSHLVGQWRRFKAANTKAAEAKALAGLREIFGKFDLSADEAVESVRILMVERNAIDAALSKSIAETPLSNDGTLIERLDRRLQEADSDHRAYRAFVGLHDDVVSACRGLVDACRALGWPDDDATVATPGRGETSTLLAEIGAATAALSKWKDLRTDDHPSWHDFEVTKAERNGLRSLLAEVGSLLLGPAGTPTEANVLGEAKALRGMVDGDHRLSAAFGQAGRRAEVTAKALSLLKSECEDVDAQIVKLSEIFRRETAAEWCSRPEFLAELAADAGKLRIDLGGANSKKGMVTLLFDLKEQTFERGVADGQADVAARLRKLLDPSDEHKLSLDGLLKSVGRLAEVAYRISPEVTDDADAPALVVCPPEGLTVLRSWNGVRLVSEDGSGSVYLCARDGGWEWHDGDEKWRLLSAESNDEQAFADGRKQGIADVRKAIANIEHNATYGANDKPVPRREDVLRLIDALGGTPPRAGELPEAEARELSERAVGVRHSVGLLLLSTRQIGKKVAERRALDDAKRNQWIVDNKLWEPQEATPVGGSRLRVPNVAVFAEAAPGVPVSVGNGVQVMVGDIATGIVAVAEDDDSTGGEVTIAHHVKWTSDGPITIRRVIE